jgi:hypothetical protein
LGDRFGLLSFWWLAPSTFEIFTGRTEGEKLGVRAAASKSGSALRAEGRGEQSNLLIF